MDVLLTGARVRKLADVAFALTALHIAWRAAQAGSTRPLAVTLAVVALHLVMAALFLMRRAERGGGDPRRWLPALPSLLVGAAVAGWPGLRFGAFSAAVFCCGALGALLSMLALGRSFAVLPGARELVARGPYRVVRHPMYLSELVMFGALVCPLPTGLGAGLVVLVGAALVWRIRAEERVLTALPEHERYVRRVPHRLLPGVW